MAQPLWIIETEAQWLAVTLGDSYRLTNHPHCHDPRRRRLLACALVRGILPHVAGDVFLRAVEMAERCADGWVAADDVALLRHEIMSGRKRVSHAIRHRCPEWYAYQAIECLTRHKTTNILQAVDHISSLEYAYRNAYSPARWVDMGTEVYVAFIRDIFGNPFRPITFDPSWRADSAVTLARQMYETRDFSNMPILADALQDAGCDNEAVLLHDISHQRL